MIVVFDLDGTLADISHRLCFIKYPPKDWETFFARVNLDKPKQPIIDLTHRFHQCGDTVIICSGRRSECREATEEWLKTHNVKYSELLMREIDDRRSDVDVKKEMLEYIKQKYGQMPDLAIDDRQRVVDFWRSQGIICLQCDQWEE